MRKFELQQIGPNICKNHRKTAGLVDTHPLAGASAGQGDLAADGHGGMASKSRSGVVVGAS